MTVNSFSASTLDYWLALFNYCSLMNIKIG